jgi:ribosomal protein S18 acetylase RimI-like enzyme
MTPVIRPARQDDLPELGRLGARLVEEHHAFDPQRFIEATTGTPEGYAAFLGSHLKSTDVLVLVAELDGLVVGYAFAALEGVDYLSLRGPAAVLHDLIVAPDRRGHGIGRLLLEAMVAELQAWGAPRIVLFTAARNEPAQRLFGRFGFRRTMIEMTCELKERT